MPIPTDPKERAKAFLTLGLPALNEAAQLGLISTEEVERVMSFKLPDGTPDADAISQSGM